MLLVFLPNLQSHELLVLQIDLFICLFYRLSNVSIIIAIRFFDQNILNMLLLKFLGLLSGVKFLRVYDPEIASIILKQNSSKGNNNNNNNNNNNIFKI